MKKKKKSPCLRRHVGLPLCLSLTVSTGALAQTAVEGHVEDVVVTDQAANSVEAVSKKQATQFQNTPQAVTVVTEQQLQSLNITNLTEAEKLEPSLEIKSYNVRNLTINIRGFGASQVNATNSIFGGVPIYIDGVYQPRPGQAVFNIPDLIGIEVPKGPQGTRGGQDATGGAVYMTTALPLFIEREAFEISAGNYGYTQINASATGPIADSKELAFRLAITGTDRQGYLDNISQPGQKYDDWHDKGGRFQILYQPTNDLSIRTVFDYSHVNQACCIESLNGAVTYLQNGQYVANNLFAASARIGYTIPGINPLNYTTDVLGYSNTAVESEGAAAIVDYDFNGFHLNSVSAYRGWDFHPNNRTSGIIEPEIYTNGNGHVSPERSIEEELKISSPKGQPVEATLGAFYLHEWLYNHSLTTLNGQAGAFYFPTTDSAVNSAALNWAGQQGYDSDKTDEIAPYVQDIWHATPEFDVTTGLRYSYYAKDALWRQYMFTPIDATGLSSTQLAAAVSNQLGFFGPNAQRIASSHQGFVSGLASASYKFTPDVMGYTTVSTGGRGGGPNVGTYASAAPLVVKPEYLYDYEVGLKSVFFNGRLQANIAAFVMVDNNYITPEVSNQFGHPTTFLGNAKRAESRGVELDLRAQPIDGLNLFASFVYDDAYYASFTNAQCPFELSFQSSCDLTGKQLALTPKFAGSIGGEYSQRLGVYETISPKTLIGYIGADGSYQTDVNSTPDASIYSVIHPYALLNLHAGIKLEDASWDLSVWAKNALNYHYFTALWDGTWDLGVGENSAQVGLPRTWGLTLRAKF